MDEIINETRAYLTQKAPPESNRKKNIIGQKQQQYVTQFFNQTTSSNVPPTNAANGTMGGNMDDAKGWGKVK